MTNLPKLPIQTDNVNLGYTNSTVQNYMGGKTFIRSATTFGTIDNATVQGAPAYAPYLTPANWGTTLTYSIWIKPATLGYAPAARSGSCFFIRAWNNTLTIDLEYLGGTLKSFSGAVLTTGIWNHILVQIDSTSSSDLVYVNGTVASGWIAKNTGAYIDASYPADTPQIMYLGDVNGGSIAEFWLSTEAIDISSSTNRERFISPSGAAVYLGEDGSLGSPTSRQPEVYYKSAALDTNVPVKNFGSANILFAGISNSPSPAADEPYTGVYVTNLDIDLDEPSIKTVEVFSDFMISPPVGQTGYCKLLLSTDAYGPYSITFGAGILHNGVISLLSSTNYIAEITVFSQSGTVIVISEVL